MTYIHGTEPTEQERLATLNRLTNAAFVQFLGVTAGARVLEVGSGLGILAAEVASAAPGVEVVGIEKSPAQIASAASAPRVRYLRGDAHRLECPDDSFDLVYARYVLEHVTDPAGVVREMRRVVRPGGRVAVCENDTSLVRVDPPCPAFERMWEAFGRYQETLGGDSFIGRRLFRLLRDAGFASIELSMQPEVHWAGSPMFVPWIRNLIGNLDSARAGLVAAGACDEREYGRAVAELEALCSRADASFNFSWNRAMATSKAG